MTRLPLWLVRIGALAALAALAGSMAVLWIGDSLVQMQLQATLSPQDLAELRGEAPMSEELARRMEIYYNGWLSRLTPLLAVIGGLLSGGLVALYPAKRLVRALGDLAATARRIGAGDLSARATNHRVRIDEIDRFTRDFNTMAALVEKSESERRDSSAAIAHELRTPLTVLGGRLQGMLDGVFPADAKGLSALLAQTHLLARIVDDLRLLTLADSGRLEVRMAPMDLADPVRAVVDGMAPLIEADGLVLTTDLTSAQMQGDADRLGQMVQALMTNAARYGGAEVHVETGASGPQVWLRVSDRGTGLSPADAPRAFERFWRADHSRGRAGGGSGLGLSVVQAIARAHGGQARYDDRPGGGAMFTVTLPALTSTD